VFVGMSVNKEAGDNIKTLTQPSPNGRGL
jgi:hypothetical protein